VDWWKSEIKKRGSLKAVYRYITRRLRADDLKLRRQFQQLRASVERRRP
jgi:hypothetical protein